MNERETIKRECSYLAVEESVRLLCPFCSGGRSDEKSLSCKRVAAGFLYNCMRASCGKSGIVAGVLGLPSAERKKKLRAYEGSLVEVPRELYEEKFKPFHLSYEVVVAEGIKYAPEHDRIYFPVYDYRRYQIGEMLRAVKDGVKPKVLANRFSTDVPFFHVPLGSDITDSLVLVEDMTSALKVSQLTPAAALLGTSLSEDTIEQFRSIGIKKITIMLDGDGAGITAAFKIHARLQPFFQSSVVFPPKNKDPKHLDVCELATLLG